VTVASIPIAFESAVLIGSSRHAGERSAASIRPIPGTANWPPDSTTKVPDKSRRSKRSEPAAEFSKIRMEMLSPATARSDSSAFCVQASFERNRPVSAGAVSAEAESVVSTGYDARLDRVNCLSTPPVKAAIETANGSLISPLLPAVAKAGRYSRPPRAATAARPNAVFESVPRSMLVPPTPIRC
jgi:hypothetical protein